MESVILEEDIDENYEPTDAEIEEYAQWLGMNSPEDDDLRWIAREGLKAPLPEHWKPCKTSDGEVRTRPLARTALHREEQPCVRAIRAARREPRTSHYAATISCRSTTSISKRVNRSGTIRAMSTTARCSRKRSGSAPCRALAAVRVRPTPPNTLPCPSKLRGQALLKALPVPDGLAGRERPDSHSSGGKPSGVASSLNKLLPLGTPQIRSRGERRP